MVLWIRSIILLILAGGIAFGIHYFSQNSVSLVELVEKVDPKNFFGNTKKKTLAPGIPSGKIPEYSLDGFDFISLHEGKKQWRIIAQVAHFYSEEDVIHAENVTVHLYDDDGEITVVTGLEAKYLSNNRNIEIFGNVNTVFPDGFTSHSEYLQYLPEKGFVHIPEPYPVTGTGNSGASESQRISFRSSGMTYEMKSFQIVLPKAVHFTSDRTTGSEKSEKTDIYSDRCIIFRNEKTAQFMMYKSRPLKDQFVKIVQPTLDSKSRQARLMYGNGGSLLQYLIQEIDVSFIEKSEVPDPDFVPRRGTSGRLDFDAEKSILKLTRFPQVYEGEDTLVGDTITIFRETDDIEIEQGNSYVHPRKSK